MPSTPCTTLTRQQPELKLLGGFGLGGIDHLIIDRGQGGGFGDFAGDSVDYPDLFSV